MTHQKHNPPIVLSMDEIGPISLQPHGGKGWFRSGHPERIPSTYKRLKGTRYLYLTLNVYHQRLSGRLYRHKGGEPWLDYVQREVEKYPKDQRVYLIQDNLSAHWTPDVRGWAKDNRVTLVASAHPSELDEPRREPRGRSAEAGAGGVELRVVDRSAERGGASDRLSESGTRTTQEEVPGHPDAKVESSPTTYLEAALVPMTPSSGWCPEKIRDQERLRVEHGLESVRRVVSRGRPRTLDYSTCARVPAAVPADPSAIPSDVRGALESNAIAFFSRMAGAPKGNLEESAQGIRICSGVPFPIFNWVLRNRFSESEADEQISATIHHFRARGLPFYWGIFPDDRPRNLRERLLAAGFEAEEAPAMAIELDRPPTPPPRKGLSIEPVRTMEQVRVFAETLNAGDFQAAPEVAETIPDVLRPSLSSGSAEPHLRCFVGYHDGKPVATSARFLSGGVVGDLPGSPPFRPPAVEVSECR